MAGASVLYSREVLALATGLGQWPLDAALPWQGVARSSTCGSTIRISLGTSSEGQITGIGIQAQACAIGQASAAIFAKVAPGRSLEEITAVLHGLQSWLANGGELPEWPGLGAIAPAQAYPARHGAILLPWEAARDALSSAPKLG